MKQDDGLGGRKCGQVGDEGSYGSSEGGYQN